MPSSAWRFFEALLPRDSHHGLLCNWAQGKALISTRTLTAAFGFFLAAEAKISGVVGNLPRGLWGKGQVSQHKETMPNVMAIPTQWAVAHW